MVDRSERSCHSPLPGFRAQVHQRCPPCFSAVCSQRKVHDPCYQCAHVVDICLHFRRKVLGILDHPHILKYFGHDSDPAPPTIHLLLEYCSGGSLGDSIRTYRRHGTFLPAKNVRMYLEQLVSALDYCHYRLGSNVVLHRDLKPDNGTLFPAHVHVDPHVESS